MKKVNFEVFWTRAGACKFASTVNVINIAEDGYMVIVYYYEEKK